MSSRGPHRSLLARTPSAGVALSLSLSLSIPTVSAASPLQNVFFWILDEHALFVQGTQGRFTIQVWNNGPALSGPITLTASVPEGLEIVGTLAPGFTCVDTLTTTSCTATELAAYEAYFVDVIVNVTADAPAVRAASASLTVGVETISATRDLTIVSPTPPIGIDPVFTFFGDMANLRVLLPYGANGVTGRVELVVDDQPIITEAVEFGASEVTMQWPVFNAPGTYTLKVNYDPDGMFGLEPTSVTNTLTVFRRPVQGWPTHLRVRGASDCVHGPR